MPLTKLAAATSSCLVLQLMTYLAHVKLRLVLEPFGLLSRMANTPATLHVSSVASLDARGYQEQPRGLHSVPTIWRQKVVDFVALALLCTTTTIRVNTDGVEGIKHSMVIDILNEQFNIGVHYDLLPSNHYDVLVRWLLRARTTCL